MRVGARDTATGLVILEMGSLFFGTVAAAGQALSRLDGDRSRVCGTPVRIRLVVRGSGELPPPAG